MNASKLVLGSLFALLPVSVPASGSIYGLPAIFAAAGLGHAEGVPSPKPAPVGLKDTTFFDIGRAISISKDFPSHGTDVDKARFVFAQLPGIAQQLDLRAGSKQEKQVGERSYTPAGIWTHALQDMLAGAGVRARRVISVVKLSAAGASPNGVDPDMALVVKERTPGGQVSRRVFDAFRAGFHSSTRQPTLATVCFWGDRPLTDADKLPRDQGRMSWLKRISKPSVKDAGTLRVVDSGVPSGRISNSGSGRYVVFLRATTYWLVRLRDWLAPSRQPLRVGRGS